jgi:3-dehydroquinate dehydratase
MPNITIDGKDYDLDSLPQQAKEQLTSLQFIDSELKRLNALTAIAMTARGAYLRALSEILNSANATAKDS